MITAQVTLHTPMPDARPLVRSRFSTDQTSFRVTTTIEHGMESCEIGFPVIDQGRTIHPWLTEPIMEYRIMGHVTVETGLDTLFQGIASASPVYAGGVIRGVTARGYWDALSLTHFDAAQAFPGGADATDSTTGAIIRAILLQVTSYVSIDDLHWTDPGVVHKPSEFDQQQAANIIDTLLREGGTDNLTYDLQFWPGAHGSINTWLVARTPPDMPDYECDWPSDPQFVNLSFDPQSWVSHVRAHYTDSGTTSYTTWQPALTDHAFDDAYGFRRELTIEAGQKTATGAAQLRDTQQSLLSVRQWGGTVNVSPMFPLCYPGTDSPVRTQIIRAGQTLRVRGLNDPTPVLLLIQQCVYDYATDSAQLTVTRGMTRKGMLRRIVETTDASRAARSAVSGAMTA